MQPQVLNFLSLCPHCNSKENELIILRIVQAVSEFQIAWDLEMREVETYMH